MRDEGNRLHQTHRAHSWLHSVVDEGTRRSLAVVEGDDESLGGKGGSRARGGGVRGCGRRIATRRGSECVRKRSRSAILSISMFHRAHVSSALHPPDVSLLTNTSESTAFTFEYTLPRSPPFHLDHHQSLHVPRSLQKATRADALQ